jgi:hypothetical protein
MAMTWMQQMFTPERSGSYQWQGRPDQGGGEFTGEQRDAQGNITYEGDAQDLRFVPRANRGPGQKMPDAVRPNVNGSGESMQTKLQDLMPAGLEPGGMSSSTPGQVDGFEELSITDSVFDPMGGGANRMLGNSRFGGQDSGPLMGSQGEGSVSMDAMYPAGKTNSWPLEKFQSGISDQGGYETPAAASPIWQEKKAAQAAIHQQRALREAEAAKMASYTNQAPEHRSLEPFGGAGDTPETYGGALNVADMVGQFSRSSLPSRKQPPGFWDWITGGKFN